jgi:hypothetical protein
VRLRSGREVLVWLHVTFCRWMIWSLEFVGLDWGSIRIYKFRWATSFMVWSWEAAEGRRASARNFCELVVCAQISGSEIHDAILRPPLQNSSPFDIGKEGGQKSSVMPNMSR